MSKMGLLGSVWHVVRGTPGIERLKPLLGWQIRADLSPRLLVLNHRPDAAYTTTEGSPLLLGRLDPATSSTPRVPVTVIDGNFDTSTCEARYDAFSNFGHVFWTTLAEGLELRERDVLQLHSISLGFLMAKKTRQLGVGEGPGVVFSPRYEQPEAVQPFVDYVLGREPSPSPVRALFEKIAEPREGAGRVTYPFEKGYLFQGLPTTINDLDALTAAYLYSVYGVGSHFSLNLTRRAEGPVVDRLIVMVPEKEGTTPKEKRGLVRKSIVEDPLLSRLYQPEGVTVIGATDVAAPDDPDLVPWSTIQGNLQCYVHLLKRALADPGADRKCTVVMPDGGVSTRLPNGEDSKGSTQIGETTLRNAGLASLVHLIRQSPDQGKGRIFLAGVDNINAGKGPLRARQDTLLYHAPYEFMLVMLPHRIDPGNTAELAKYRERGTAVVDPRTRRVKVMLEKESPHVLSRVMTEHGTNILEENTMWQIMTVEFARKVVALFDRPCYAAPGKTLIEHYGILDFSTDLVSPQTLTTDIARGEYLRKFGARCRKADIAFDLRDAEMILDGVSALTDGAGIGAVEVGFFSDAGDFAAYIELHRMMLETNPKRRGLQRFLQYVCGLDLERRIHLPDDQIHIVQGPDDIRADKVNIFDPTSVYIGTGVSLAPGTVVRPQTGIFGNTSIESSISLPAMLIVSGAELQAAVNFTNSVSPRHPGHWRLIYGVVVKPNFDLSLPNDGAMIGFRLPDKTTPRGKLLTNRWQIGFLPISLALKRDKTVVDPVTGQPALDPVFGHYPLVSNIPADVLMRGTEYSWVKFAAEVVPVRPATKA